MLSMIVIFPLSKASREILVVLDLHQAIPTKFEKGSKPIKNKGIHLRALTNYFCTRDFSDTLSI